MYLAIKRTLHQNNRLNKQGSLYSILGIDQSASQLDIKQAYFKLAKKLHPDINKATDAQRQFAELNQAYETLINPAKRRIYDQSKNSHEYSHKNQEAYDFSGFNPFAGAAAGNFSEFFEEFDNLFKKQDNQQQSLKGEDVKLNIEIEFLDSIHGTRKELEYARKILCKTCKGTKAKPGTQPIKCHNCSGKGFIVFQRGPLTHQVQCNNCNASGELIKYKCNTCKGKGTSYQHANHSFNIPAGIKNNETINFQNLGHQIPNGLNGDLQINVQVKKHPYFIVKDDDLYCNIQISISEAVLGATLNIDTVYGQQQISINPPIDLQEYIIIPSCGLPKSNKQSFGNLYIKLLLKSPRQLTQKQKEIFQELAQIDGVSINISESPFLDKFKKYFK